MRLWIETAHRGVARAGSQVCGDVVRTFQSEQQFFSVLVSDSRGDAEGRERAGSLADRLVPMLRQEAPLDEVVESALAGLPAGVHVPWSVFQAFGNGQARVVECDAPPLFLVQHGQPVLLPVVEGVAGGRLVRRGRFVLQAGDYVALVSEGYLLPRRPGWAWADVAVAVRRWTDTNCDAEALLDALMGTYRRLKPVPPLQDVTVLALHARPVRSVTVWTGPPADPAQDGAALDRLLAWRGMRVICGDTTATVAARLLGRPLVMEERPEHGWLEVPPLSTLEGVDLVTEGLVTMGKARERMAGARTVRDLPQGDDGATRLAGVLLQADCVRFVVGLAVNPQQVDGSGVPLRRGVVEGLVRDLEARGKLVSVEYV